MDGILKQASPWVGLMLFVACTGSSPFPPGSVVTGVWGAQGAGFMGDDTSAHVHVGCTYGDVHQPITTDPNGRFDIPGQYNITAHPVDLGVLHPARFIGSIAGRRMTLSVQLTDTAVTLGPVSLVFEQDPTMGPCPICIGPRARAQAAQRMRRTPL